jgi:hypothetical protein
MNKLRRIDFEELPPRLAERLEARVKRLGYLGEFFRCTAHQPDALVAFIDFTEAGKRALAANLVELIALTCAGWMENPYERNQHERLCLKIGFSEDWIREVNRLTPEEAVVMSAAEALVQRFVIEMLSTKGLGAARMMDGLIEALGPAEAVAVLMIVGRYVVHALVVNSLSLEPPVASIFEEASAS